MSPTDAERQSLLELCAASDVPHRAEFLPLVADPANARSIGATIEVHEVPAGRDLQGIYRGRAELLTIKEQNGTLTQPSDTGRRMPSTLAEDVRRLSAALDAADDQPVRIWNVQLPDRTCYVVFVLVRDRTIAGVVKSVSERRTSP